ncbi:hypothetical protein PA598K_01473 [Paenibacillus sp. 598K]|uniref:hypothetical protein n=1 Tax=Paenibacillus sp. 598K TaxID=1117987 RepID=UPI000FF9D59A|nr:hypothetical protein [Paenibacillus sp. 598K]GBF73188.1 hypothetical protein PA598K_01473 [Paenibacillus sp. 598K]
MSDFLLFMLFSTFEGLAVYAAATYTFRINLRRYIWHTLLILEIINVQNYLARTELHEIATVAAPLLNILISILFFVVVVRAPLLWSGVMAVTGVVVIGVVQTSLIFGIFGGVDQMNTEITNTYLIQFLTGFVVVVTGNILYRRGFGFTFDFDKVLRFERLGVIVAMILTISFILGMMLLGDLRFNLVGFLVVLAGLLFFAIRRERTHGI